MFSEAASVGHLLFPAGLRTEPRSLGRGGENTSEEELLDAGCHGRGEPPIHTGAGEGNFQRAFEGPGAWGSPRQAWLELP